MKLERCLLQGEKTACNSFPFLLKEIFECRVHLFIATAYISAPGDAELMCKMKETIDNQRDTIRSKNMEIDSLRNDLQAVCTSNELCT